LEWTENYQSGENCTKTHSWEQAGTYEVKVKAKDVHQAESAWSLVKTVTITSNDAAPQAPSTPSGNTSLFIEETGTYSSTIPASVLAPVYIKFSWGDGSETSWEGPHNAEATIVKSHSWDEAGKYDVKAHLSYNVNGDSPSHSSALKVTVLSHSNVTISSIKGGLGVSAILKNNGDEDADGLDWTITVKSQGKLGRVDVDKDGTADIDAGEETTAKSGLFFGLGRVDIDVKVTAAGETLASKSGEAFVFGILVFIR